jgi:hypothetical protein
MQSGKDWNRLHRAIVQMGRYVIASHGCGGAQLAAFAAANHYP